MMNIVEIWQRRESKSALQCRPKRCSRVVNFEEQYELCIPNDSVFYCFNI